MMLSVSGRSGRDDTPDNIAAAVLAARLWDAVHSSVMFMNECTKNTLRTLAASGGNNIAPHAGGDGNGADGRGNARLESITFRHVQR